MVRDRDPHEDRAVAKERVKPGNKDSDDVADQRARNEARERRNAEEREGYQRRKDS